MSRNFVKGGARELRVGAAQRVVGAEFDNHRVGAIGDRPIEPRQSISRRVAGDARIEHVDVQPACAQCLLELCRKRLRQRQAQSRSQGIAEGDELDRPLNGGLTVRCTRHQCRGHQHAQHKCAKPLDRPAQTPI